MRIFSGIRPSGELHLGNYLGAIKQWVELQNNNECIFCIVDLHAITTPYDAQEMPQRVIDQAISYLALGLNPEKCILIVQSHLKEHLELAWLLGSITPIGELQRMTQFKEKKKKHKKYINAGLLNYPVLMAADILIYQSEIVPVGEDQKQHVELTQTIAKKFNNKFGETFKIPKVQMNKDGARIMSLSDPKSKMSKSDGGKGCIDLFEEPQIITKKIMSAVTDTQKKIKYDRAKKPGISNLLNIYSLLKDISVAEAEEELKGKSYSEFKKILADLTISFLEPLRSKRNELASREVYVQEILSQGAKRAKIMAQETMDDVKKKMGL